MEGAPDTHLPEAEPVLSFLAGKAPDNRGRPLEYILAQDDEWWEENHDFIQWLFPLPERSEHHPRAPVLSPEAVAVLKTDALVQDGLKRALLRYARSLGLVQAKEGNWQLDSRRQVGLWARVQTHQDLRISRVLRCLCLAGLAGHAKAFHEVVAKTVANYRLYGHQPAMGYWERARAGA